MILTTASGDILNFPQRSAISTRLRELEMTLRHMPDDLLNHEQGTLYAYEPSLSPEALEQMQEQMALALKDIDELTTRLSLIRSTESNTSILLSKLAVLWSDLCDIRVETMNRYGEVSPELDAALSPAHERRTQRVEIMLGLLGTNRDHAQAPP